MSQSSGLLLTTVSEIAALGNNGIADRVPFARGFDLARVLRDDPDPFFVTLPIARVGARSRGDQKLLYGERANRLIVEQVMSKQPEGGRGHVPERAVGTQYDLPDVMAVGALLENGTTWGKFYVPKYATATRDYYRAKASAGALAAFSLWGRAQADLATKEVIELDLQRIDMADPARAGLPVEAVPIITSHMISEVNDMTDLLNARIAEMFDQPLSIKGADLWHLLVKGSQYEGQPAPTYDSAAVAQHKAVQEELQRLNEMLQRKYGFPNPADAAMEYEGWQIANDMGVLRGATPPPPRPGTESEEDRINREAMELARRMGLVRNG